jgi:phospholipase/carboxylesterase
MSTIDLTTAIIEPSAGHRGTVIWLHGLGASHHDFLPVVPALELPFLRFVFPSAPLRPVTLYGGQRCPAWYDILGIGPLGLRENEAQLREMTRAVQCLIDREHARGVPHDRIVLAGFSQGGAMALHAGLRSARTLGAILVLSGYLPLASAFGAEAPARRDVPILFCHGRRDGVVPHAGGRMSYELIKAAGFDASWAEFDVAHSMNMDEVRFISGWLGPRFAGE